MPSPFPPGPSQVAVLQPEIDADPPMLFDFGVMGIFCYAALAWGSNEPWAMAIVSITTFTVLAGRTIWDFWRGSVQIIAEWAFAPLLLFLAYAGLQRLRPATALHQGSVSPPLTLEPHSTGLYLLLATAYVALIFLVTHGFRSRGQVKRLVLCVIALGAFEALYGLTQYLGGYNYIWDYQFTGDRARGTLINSNHYAFLLNITICCGFGYLYYRSMRLLRGQNLSLRSVLTAPGSGQLAWLILWLGLMGMAVIFSMSRMGIVAMLAGIGMMAICAKASEHGKRTRILGLVLLCVILGLAVYTGIDAVLARFEPVVQSGYLDFDKDRFPIWRQTWSMVQGHTTFGQGLGTVQWSLPAYEDLTPDLPAKYAHNDYLQALAEVGWVGLLLVAAAFAASWRTALRNLGLGFDPLVRGIGVATLGVLTVAAVHEIADFSLYIPGVAVLFAVLIGLNFRAAVLRRENAPSRAQVPYP